MNLAGTVDLPGRNSEGIRLGSAVQQNPQHRLPAKPNHRQSKPNRQEQIYFFLNRLPRGKKYKGGKYGKPQLKEKI
jgi:hypothetical protein